jgi:uncharacterized membrane protein YczE
VTCEWPTSIPGRVGQLVGGLLLAAVGICLTIRAGLGVASWEVLHIALAEHLGVGIGTASVLVGGLLVLLVVALGVRPGIGTVLNVLVIGVALNVLLGTSVLATVPARGLAERVLVLLAGIVVFAVGCAVYVGAHLGPGPRDGLMLALHLRFDMGVGTARVISEGAGLGLGWLLGGPVGLGTILFVVVAGPSVALAFRWLRLRPLPAHGPKPRAPRRRSRSPRR